MQGTAETFVCVVDSWSRASGEAELVEENTWGDRFWGRSRGVGKNMLGQLLTALRKLVAGDVT